MKNNRSSRFVLGKYVLDSLSVGMYNNPLMLYREYIQNSADAIDESDTSETKNSVKINIDGAERTIRIRDDGCGIKANDAFNLLHSIGSSRKRKIINKGFRGIGRLGGLGYCDKLKFITKSKGEKIYSISAWDCKEFRQLINDNSKLSANNLLKKTTGFYQEIYGGDLNHHYFEVIMENVKSTRDILMNVPLVKQYIAQVAPVPFNCSRFCHGSEIDENLKAQVGNYSTYNIFVNGEKILKPYVRKTILPLGICSKCAKKGK